MALAHFSCSTPRWAVCASSELVELGASRVSHVLGSMCEWHRLPGTGVGEHADGGVEAGECVAQWGWEVEV